MLRINHRAAVVTVAAGLLLGAYGCSHDNVVVPPDAMTVASGNQSVAMKASSDGTVYLQDEGNNAVVATAQVHKGQIVKYDASGHDLLVDGTAVKNGIPTGSGNHELKFSPAQTASGTSGTANPTTMPSNGQSGTVVTVPVPVRVEVQPTTQPAGQ